ncbi:MAG TPA: tetratricopeptide repeat protein [Candidatus Bathyarchaeia archaeon]|nr:tetratricopeptide repeat protein [Candidatus Bathyarchaeia archaeon]
MDWVFGIALVIIVLGSVALTVFKAIAWFLLIAAANNAADMLLQSGAKALKDLVLGSEEKRALRAVFTQALRATFRAKPRRERNAVIKLWQAFLAREGVADGLVATIVRGAVSDDDAAGLIEAFQEFHAHEADDSVDLRDILTFLAELQRATGKAARAHGNALFNTMTTERLELIVKLLTKKDEAPKAPPPPAARRSLEADLNEFTGRGKEIQQLIEALRKPGGRAVISAAIRGMGGVGKTVLAVHVAHQLEDIYPDAQIQVNLQGYSDKNRLTPAQAMTVVLRRLLGPKAQLPEDPEQLAKDYEDALADKRALILLDNVCSEKQIEGLITGTHCGFIVTSRNTIFIESGALSIPLDKMDPDDARNLLRTLIEKYRPCPADDDLDKVAELCGCLPLLLYAAGSFLATHEDYSVDRYMDEVHQTVRHGKVDPVLGYSARRLIEDDLEAAVCWQMLTVFTAPFDVGGAAAVLDIPEDKAEDRAKAVLSELRRQGLLLYNRGTQRYTFHDFLRPIAQHVFQYGPDEASEDVITARDEQHTRRTDAQRRHAQHYETVLRKAKELYKKGGDNIMVGLALADLEWNHILAGQAWAAEHVGSDETATRLCNAYPDAGAYVLDLRLHLRELIKWLESALAAARQLGDREAEGANLGNLGMAYAALDETRRAIEYYEQALVILREIGDRRGEGVDLGNLGNAYILLGEPRRAIEYYEQALVIDREIGDRRGEGAVLGNLGIAYKDLGEQRRAIEYYEQALVILREIGDRRGEGVDLGNLGNSYFLLGDPRRAIEYYEQYLEMAHKISDRRGEGNALGNLGNAYAALGDTRRAIEYYEQALVIRREVGDRRGEGNDLYNLAGELAKLGQRDEAIGLAQESLAIRETIEDPNAPTVRALLERLGAGPSA